MSEEILINVTPTETRVAVVENGMLQEVSLERNSHVGYLGNIYKGTVSRVLPGMQAAFIDIGLDRTAFLHASDIYRVEREQMPEDPPPEPPIASLVREGEQVVVQVIKDPLGTKGARLTTNLSIPSRFLVLLPESETLAVSLRIEDEVERERLKGLLATMTSVQPPGRFGALDIDKHQLVRQFKEKPKGDGNWINGGFFILSPKVIDYIAGDETVWEKEPLEAIAAEGQLTAYKHQDFWLAMDTLRDKMKLEELWEKGNAPWKVWEK